MSTIPRHDIKLNAALEVLDERFASAKDGPDKFRYAWESLADDEMKFVADEIYKCRTDLRYYLENYHVIKDEHGNIQTLYPLWDHQEILHGILEREWATKGTYRLIILKPRQMGGTAYSSAVIFHATIFFERAFSLVMAQSRKTTAEIYRRIWDAYNNLPWFMRAERESKQQEVHLVFQREDEKERMADPGLASTMLISNAQEQAGVAIGRTISSIHGSEVSRWPDSDVWSSDIEPSMNARHTRAILESTACGRRGLFFNLWTNAESGESEEWTPVFIPVYRVRKYFLPLRKGEGFTLTDEEINIRNRVKQEENFTISYGFFKWRRRKIKAAIHAEGDDRGEFKHQEAYPVTSGEAFISSGSCAFPRKCLNEQEREFCKDPVLIGEIEYMGSDDPPVLYVHKPTHEEVLAKPKRENRLWIWETPDDNEAIEYYGAADVSSGTSRDFSDGTFYRIGYGIEPSVQVAEWHGLVNPAHFARILAALGIWYHTCELAVEYQQSGVTTGNELRVTLDYPNLYRWKKMDLMSAMTQHIHWVTNMQNREDAITRMGQHLLDRTIVIRNRHTIQEMRDFGRYDESYKAMAMDTNNDDAVMANMICMAALYQSGKRQEWAENTGLAGEGSRHANLLPKTPQVYAIVDHLGRQVEQQDTEPKAWDRIDELGKKSGIPELRKLWKVVSIQVSKANTIWSPIWDSTGAEHELQAIHGMDSHDVGKNPDAVLAMRRQMQLRSRFGDALSMVGEMDGED